jgi:hypothetical protein
MVVGLMHRAGPVEFVRRHRWIAHFVLFPATLGVIVALVSWWNTEPLADVGGPVSTRPAQGPIEPTSLAASTENAEPSWPEARLDGDAAKTLLLSVLTLAAQRLDRVPSYTATFHKQERIDGKLGPLQTMSMKVRQHPFALYFKFLSPHAGKEVVYAEGHHDNKVVAHGGGLTRLLLPRLAVPPDHPLALADSRHAVTEAGLTNLAAKLIRFRKMDLDDREAETVLDRFTDACGRAWLRSVHTHPTYHEERPFARVEVLYDPETRLPIDIRNFDWPQPGHAGELLLAEHYAYEDLDLDADLTAIDFDPANPAYQFHRY